MQEICTYGLMRGRWAVRFVRQPGVYSTIIAGTSSRLQQVDRRDSIIIPAIPRTEDILRPLR